MTKENRTMQPPAKAEEEVPVLIVGGGGAGLTASMRLAA
jgi:ribulose 1,5-bisphosphate synthetase/thiazole synthase